jgi:hypothetical protein
MMLKPLDQRILAVLPTLDAPTVSQMAARLQMDPPRVRAAYDVLEASGRAKIVRRGVGLHLVPVDYPGRICPVCRAEFKNKHSHVRCCSKSCSSVLMWRTRDRKAQGEVMRRAWAGYTPEKRNEINRKSHRTPEYLARFGERNRKDWADPVKRMKRVVGLEAAWRGPQAEPRKQKARTQKLSFWSDPERKVRVVEAMLTGKRGRHMRALISMVAEGAEAEEIAARTARTIEQTKVLWRRCYRLGKVDRQPADGRKNRARAA